MSGPKIIDTVALRAVEKARLMALCAQLEWATERCNARIDGLSSSARFEFERFAEGAVDQLKSKVNASQLVSLMAATREARDLLTEVKDRHKSVKAADVDSRASERANRLALREMTHHLKQRAASNAEAMAILDIADSESDLGAVGRMLEQASQLVNGEDDAWQIGEHVSAWLEETSGGGCSRMDAVLLRPQREMARFIAELESLSSEDISGYKKRLSATTEMEGDARIMALDSLRIELAELAHFARKVDARRDVLEMWQSRTVNGAFQVGEGLLEKLLEQLTENTGAFESTIAALDLAYEKYCDQLSAEETREAITKALRDLGYELSVEMERAWAKDGKVYVSRPNSTDYAVELATMPAGAAMIRSRLVRANGVLAASDDERQRDKEQEENWCADHAEILKALTEGGIKASIKTERAAGVIPLEVMESSSASTRSNAAQSVKNKEREM